MELVEDCLFQILKFKIVYEFLNEIRKKKKKKILRIKRRIDWSPIAIKNRQITRIWNIFSTCSFEIYTYKFCFERKKTQNYSTFKNCIRKHSSHCQCIHPNGNIQNSTICSSNNCTPNWLSFIILCHIICKKTIEIGESTSYEDESICQTSNRKNCTIIEINI